MRWGKTFGLSAGVGILSGLAAVVLEFGLHGGVEHLIGRFTHVSDAGILNFHWGILLLPAMGGLLVGLLLRFASPGEETHGTDQLIRAFHQRQGELPLRDPGIKAAAAVGLIACGGSAGPEGPIAALGAATGSTLARLLSLPARWRRILLVAGCAGGVGAIFRCPLGGALFATSVLYSEPEFEADSIVPAFVASIVSYSTFMSFWGFGRPLIENASELVFASAAELIPYLLLGPVCALLSGLLLLCLRVVELGHRLTRIPAWLWPVIGGLGVGVLGCTLPQIMDAQYQFIQHAVDGTLFTSTAGTGRSWRMWAAVFACVAVVKCLASALTVGTARAGGLLGPSVFIGGVAGAFVGAMCEVVYPGVFPEALRKALIPVGMAGVLAASMRVPMAAIVMVTEMSGSYGLIVPLMLVATTAYVLGRRWGLNASQVRSSEDSPAHAGDILVHLLQSYRVGDLMKPDWPHVVSPSTSLSRIIAALPSGSGSRPVFAVVEEGKLMGTVSMPDISRPCCGPGLSEIINAADIMGPRPKVLSPQQSLYDVLEFFQSAPVDALPVVAREDRRTFLGMLSRDAIHQVVRSHADAIRTNARREHAGLAGIEHDEMLRQLMLGMSSAPAGALERMHVPRELVGRSLRETNFRKEYRAQVIAIQSADGTLQCPPDADAPLREDQILLAISAPPAGFPTGSPGTASGKPGRPAG